jgi:hypothetical protein
MIGSKRAMSFADKTAELWFEIDQLHLSFLQHDETPPKVISRRLFCVFGSVIFAGLGEIGPEQSVPHKGFYRHCFNVTHFKR